MLDLTKRFSFGVNLDDSWRYAGFRQPKSIIIPHLLSISLPEGRVLDRIDDILIHQHGEQDPRTASDRASLALAENLADARVDFVRCWFSWRFFEPTPVRESELDGLLEAGYPEWPLDGLVKALTDRGIGVVPVVACGYQRMLPHGLRVDANAGLYLKRASIHTRLLVRRYKSSVRFWQIENEPNWWRMHEAGGWREGASWIETNGFRDALLDELNAAVHAEEPNAVTIVNLEADTKMEDASRYTGHSDMVGLDFYPNYRSSSPISTSVFETADRLAKGLGKPVLISETGYPSGPSILGYSALKQAEYTRQACLDAHRREGVSGIGLWRYIDTSWRSFPEQENHFGLFDGRGNPKPSWSALKETIGALR